MTDRLRLYNDALLICGQRAVSSLTEEIEARRLLDQVWDSNGVRKCLEHAQWHFAMRTIRIDADPDVTPDYGLSKAFQKPEDWVLTSGLCTDEYFRSPLLNYVDEAGYWYADMDTIYVRYVSDAVDYGLDLNKWPDSFEEYVASYFAEKVVYKITTDLKRLEIAQKLCARRKLEAKSRAAMAEPTMLPATGNWSRARLRSSRKDRGNNTGSLIG